MGLELGRVRLASTSEGKDITAGEQRDRRSESSRAQTATSRISKIEMTMETSVEMRESRAKNFNRRKLAGSFLWHILSMAIHGAHARNVITRFRDISLMRLCPWREQVNPESCDDDDDEEGSREVEAMSQLCRQCTSHCCHLSLSSVTVQNSGNSARRCFAIRQR